MNASTTAPTQTALTADFCILRPKKNMIAAPIAGNSGINQILSKKNIMIAASAPLQQIHFVHVHGFPVSEKRDQDPKPHRRFYGSIRNHENRKHLPLQSPQSRERHHVQIDGTQD